MGLSGISVSDATLQPDPRSDHDSPAAVPALLPMLLGVSSSLLIYLVSPKDRQRRRIARLRSQIAEIERSRVACELHDGAIQSLIGLEMEVAAWLLSDDLLSAAAARRLRQLQRRLRKEIVNLRELTQRLRPVHVDPSKILTHLADVVSGFQRDTGIAATFTSNVAEVDLPPLSCFEAGRIVQEALINVRKHSGATSVSVKFDADKRHWRLSIEDNGFGFDFSGRRSHVERDCMEEGPSVIKERVRLLRGELTIASDPGRGARLEIKVPRVDTQRSA